MGLEFCAYEIEIPCTSTPVDCGEPSASPSGSFYPSSAPTESPTKSVSPTASPTDAPSGSPTANPTVSPTASPTGAPTANPTASPTATPTESPSGGPTGAPTANPTASPTDSPTANPTASPSDSPTANPTANPTASPTESPTANPTVSQSPTGCDIPNPPRVVQQVCMSNAQDPMENPLEFPLGAIDIRKQSGDDLQFYINQEWTGNVGIAIRNGSDCEIQANLANGDLAGAYQGMCIDNMASVTIVVYTDPDFDADDCEAR